MIHKSIYIYSLFEVGLSTPLFFAFGDWGDDDPQMASVIARLHAEPKSEYAFLLGDLFYPSGVSSVKDPQFLLFNKFSDAANEFFCALGNHDYMQPISSLIAYSQVDPKWILPSRYYLKRIDLGSGVELCAIILDTYSVDSSQLSWLEEQLSWCSNSFRFIFTHYPMLTVGVYASSGTVSSLRTKILPLIEKYQVHAYISGHEHQMQAFERLGTHFLISGATAEMARSRGTDLSKWTSELRYHNDQEEGILYFYKDSPGSLWYRFVRASDGAELYRSTISLGGAINVDPIVTTQAPVETTTTTTTELQATMPTTEKPVQRVSTEAPSHPTVPSVTTSESQSTVPSETTPTSGDSPENNSPDGAGDGNVSQPGGESNGISTKGVLFQLCVSMLIATLFE
jgi:hypothetical protein